MLEGPDGAERIDVSGKYIVPGLMDANVHLVPWPSWTYIEFLARYENNFQGITAEAAQIALKHGFTTVFDSMGLINPVYSYGDTIAVSFTADRDMLPDPDKYAAALRQSFEDLKAAAAQPRGANENKPAAKPKAAAKPRTASAAKTSAKPAAKRAAAKPATKPAAKPATKRAPRAKGAK